MAKLSSPNKEMLLGDIRIRLWKTFSFKGYLGNNLCKHVKEKLLFEVSMLNTQLCI